MPELCRQHNAGLLKQYGDLFATSLVDDSLVPIKINTADEEETLSSFTYARKALFLRKKELSDKKTVQTFWIISGFF